MSSKAQIDAVQEIIQASACGREIVCLLGAGVSVDAGIPHLTKLTEYLAKVQCYITKGAFQPQKSPEDHHPHFGDEYLDDPSQYIRHFGWPDLNQLNADLWQWIDQGFAGDPEERREYLDYLVRAERIEDLLRFEPELEQARLAKKLKNNQRKGRVRFNTRKWEESGLWHLQGNWKTLLAYLTHSNPDYTDTLFQSLIRDRCPGMTHRFLAFLTPILGLRLFLTVNFDDLLEKALRTEGHDPVVYAVARESPLPHPSLVRRQLSVVKLHGDTFRLLVGEGLDNPLDEDSKSRLKDYVGNQPLLMVLGVGGADRRINDLVKLVAGKWKGNEAAVYWVHFGAKTPESVQKLVDCMPGAVCAVSTYSPASFLLEMLTRETGAHPPSLRAYEPRMLRPIVPDSGNGNGPVPGCVTVFRERKGIFDFGASLDLACFLASRAATHTLIWIDLSAMHTYEDLAIEIIRQIRRYDRSVPPLALPGEASQEGVTKAVRRVFEALVRDRYVLALNNAGAFGRPPTCHHWPRKDRPEASADPSRDAREELLRNEFLGGLIAEARRPNGPLRDSLFALALPEEIFPHLGPGEKNGRSWGKDKPALPESFQDRYGDALLLLAAPRRRWCYAALLELLPCYLPEGERTSEHVDTFLQQVESRYLLRSEGAEYWICRGIRDGLYEDGRKGTSLDEMRREEAGDGPALRLARLARIHRDLAWYYYSHLYAASQEPNALLESIYHQIATLRYLARLDVWCQSRSVPSETKKALGRWLGDWSLDPDLPEAARDPLKAVRELRRRQLRMLRRVFEREREALLGLLSPDTLIGWVRWIREKDLPKLVLDKQAQDRPILRENAVRLREQLLELEADALRNQMDFRSVLRLRFAPVGELLGCEIQPSDPGALIKTLAALHKKRGSNQSPEDLLKLARGLCDIWLCLRGMDKKDEAAELCRFFESVLEEARSQFVNGSEGQQQDLEAMKIRWLRGKADHHLTAISPWRLRGAPEGERQEVLKACEQAIETCDQGLGTIEWATGTDYARHSSYFHSFKGRALYLRAFLSPGSPTRSDDLAAAHRELDRAQAGLLPQLGANRESLAVSLLRLAECLMVRADTFLRSRDPLGDPVKAISSAARELDRATEVLDRAEAMLDGARQNLEWWSCLYQLRAQIQVEHLLLQISGHRADDPEVSKLDARLPHTVQVGLRALRQGFDVLLPVHCRNGSPQPPFRMVRFLRIWTELAVCGTMLARIGWKAHQPPDGRGSIDQEAQVLWGRWTSLNKTAGLALLVDGGEAQEFFARIDRRIVEPPPYGLGARNETLRLISEAVAEIGIWEKSWIWMLLRAEFTEHHQVPDL